MVNGEEEEEEEDKAVSQHGIIISVSRVTTVSRRRDLSPYNGYITAPERILNQLSAAACSTYTDRIRPAVTYTFIRLATGAEGGMLLYTEFRVRKSKHVKSSTLRTKEK